eukprot:3930750-Pyramimonas_sp.AAC.1
MVCFLLERGVQRHHGRALAEKLEPLRRFVNPRTKGIGLSAQGKYLVKTAFCECLWTEDRARSSGYLCLGLCPLCQRPDS